MAFDFTFFETIDSTSSEAMRRIEGGVMPPFVVAARTQTSGRGRRGKSWTSPPGGIYLSIALPIQNIEALSTLSLEVGVAVSMWIEKNFGFRPTLKWPNDIYFEAKKLAGILCESALSGQSIRGVVIGVGINLKSAPEPQPKGSSENPRISLSEISGSASTEFFEKDFEFSLKSLAGFLLEKLQDRASLLESFSLFDTRQGLWLKEGLKYRDLGIDPSQGNLNLVSIANGEKVSLSSVNHDFTWWPLSNEARGVENLLIADLGNSSLKLFKTQHDSMIELGRFANGGELAQNGQLLSLKNKIIAFGVVGENSFTEYSKIFEELGATVCRIKKRTLRVNLASYDLNLMGIDRLAFMEGYLKKRKMQLSDARSQKLPWRICAKQASSPSEPDATAGSESQDSIANKTGAILISAGTATTIDIIQEDGKYLGGLIMPGVQTSLLAMHASTSLLPILRASDLFKELQPRTDLAFGKFSFSEAPSEDTGENSFYWQNLEVTSDAMRAGVYASLNGAVALIQNQLKIIYPELEFDCIVSGGFSALVEGAVTDHELVPLGLFGMAIG